MRSEFLKRNLDQPTWFHGSADNFPKWTFPPPRKDSLSVPHTAIFFTTNINYARGTGPRVARVSLRSDSQILDTTCNYQASEQLRNAVAKNSLARMLLNVDNAFWHRGWIDGSVLRMTYISSAVDNHLAVMVSGLTAQTGMHRSDAEIVVKQGATRGFIELICDEARKLGYDALFGHEIDRHSTPGVAHAQPWLAVLRTGVMSDPDWA